MAVIRAPSADQAGAASRRAAEAGTRLRIESHTTRSSRQASLPIPRVNAIVGSVSATDAPSVPASEVLRLLRPSGGIVALTGPARPQVERSLRQWGEGVIPGWSIQKAGPDGQSWVGVGRRGPLAGAGEWTHFYGDPGNSACSGDALEFGPVDIQWFGRPGPRRMVDRHEKNMAPLYKDGRMFVTGDNYVVAVDAYNGTVLWERDLPNRSASGRSRTAARWPSAIAISTWPPPTRALPTRCQERRAAAVFTAPGIRRKDRRMGLRRNTSGPALGSTTKPGANWRVQDVDTQTLIWRDKQPVVASDTLFAVEPSTGKTAWTYRPEGGTIVNPTLAAAADRVYFVESANRATFDVPDGRITLDLLFGQGADLVALELGSGKQIWRTRTDLSRLENVVFMSHADDTLVITGSRNAVIEGSEKPRVR